jgi:hypothetical protein
MDLGPCVPTEGTGKEGAPHTGTTIVAVTFKGGVVLGADGRVSTGTYISNRASNKIQQLTENAFLLRSGSAADTQAIGDYGAAGRGGVGGGGGRHGSGARAAAPRAAAARAWSRGAAPARGAAAKAAAARRGGSEAAARARRPRVAAVAPARAALLALPAHLTPGSSGARAHPAPPCPLPHPPQSATFQSSWRRSWGRPPRWPRSPSSCPRWVFVAGA